MLEVSLSAWQLCRSCDKREAMAITYLLLVVVRWIIMTLLLAAGLFLVSGNTHLRMLNAFILVFAPSLLAMMLAVSPRIAQDCKQAETKGGSDRKVRAVLVVLFLATIALAAFDVGHLHLSDNVPVILSVIALIMFAVASGFQAWAMSVNSFYSPLIHIQADRGHSVVTCGPYRILRHPAYFANLVAVPASALAIGSWMALIPAAACCAFTVWRARKEDSFLKHNLAGYREYMEAVPGGVLPRLPLKL
jgi:protein-S-isoprenylcysteine O-methyltransferase Ste14